MPGRGVQGITGILVRPAIFKQGRNVIASEEGKTYGMTEAGLVGMFFVSVSWCVEFDWWLREAGIENPN